MPSEPQWFREHFLVKDFFCRLSIPRALFRGAGQLFENIKCVAFGVPETLNRVRRRKGMSSQAGDYIRNDDGRNNIQVKCGLCGSKNPCAAT